MTNKTAFSFKRLILFILLAIPLFFMTDTTQVSAQDETSTEDSGGGEEQTFVIATDTTYAPFEFTDSEGNLVGIDMDILRAIAEDQGFNVEIQVLGFNAALQAVESGSADGMIAAMGITEERDQSFDFSDPYMEVTTHFAVPPESDIQSIDDLEGETVAVKTGTTGATAAAEIQDEVGFEIRTFEDTSSMTEDVLTGNSVAAVDDYPVLQYAITTGAVDLRVIEEPISTSPIAFAVSEGQNQELLQMFNEGLANIQENGTYDEIINSYLGDQAIEEAQASSPSNAGELIAANAPELLNGLLTTLWITLVAFVMAMVIGLIIGLMSTSNSGLLNGIATVYIDIFRSIPLIVLAFLIYFGIPQLFGFNMANTTAGIISLGLNASAYIAEIFRGGIEAIDPGQKEAGVSLGLSTNQTMRHIVLPQGFKVMVPSFLNQFVITLKDTSILSVIGIVELTQSGRLIIARTYQSGIVWITVGIIYVVIIVLLTRLSNRIGSTVQQEE